MIQEEVFWKVRFVYSSVINTAIFCCKQFQIDCVAENTTTVTLLLQMLNLASAHNSTISWKRGHGIH